MSLAAHEAIEHHKEFYPSQAAHYGAAFGEFLALGASLTSEQVAQANLLRGKITQSWEVHLSDLDAFACPVGGYILPLTVSQYDGIETISKMLAPLKAQFTIPASFSGLPTLTLPCGAPPTKGLPYAMQLYGNCLGEQLLCEIGDAYENITNWHKRHPPC